MNFHTNLISFTFISLSSYACKWHLVCSAWRITNYKFQVRNKPIEPPKKPEKAPFFLPSVPSLSGEILFEPGKLSEKEDGTGGEKPMSRTRLEATPSRFLYLLQTSKETDSCKNPTVLFLFAYCIDCSLLEFIHSLKAYIASISNIRHYVLQMEHSLIISKGYRHRPWIWNFECFRSLMTMISKKLRIDLNLYQLNSFWIILFMSSPAEIILSLFKLLSGYFWRFGTSLVLGQFNCYTL